MEAVEAMETERFVMTTARLIGGSDLEFEVYDPMTSQYMSPTLPQSLCAEMIRDLGSLTELERINVLQVGGWVVAEMD